MNPLLILPIVGYLMEGVKRLVPDRYRGWAIPLISILTGGSIAWGTGGHEAGMAAVIDALTGGAAGLGASGGYSFAKSAGASLGIK
jgi:hypothetical protein